MDALFTAACEQTSAVCASNITSGLLTSTIGPAHGQHNEIVCFVCLSTYYCLEPVLVDLRKSV